MLSPSDGARRELATSLGFAGTGTATDGGWTWSGGTGGHQLRILEDGQWSFDTGLPSPPTPVPPAEAIRLVSGLLQTLGLTGAHAAAPAAPTVVQANPTVDGRPTAGLVTVLSVGPAGVENGAGWLVRSGSGPAYPLMSARAAWNQLVRTPLPMPLIACPEPGTPGSDPVTCGGPITVTGAQLGRAPQQSTDGQLLVPAWLFTVDGSPQPLVEVAVEPRLVVPASAGAGTSGTVTGGGGSSTGSGGVPVPDLTATPVPPAPPSAGTVAPVQQSHFTSVRATGSVLDVRFWGGVASCFGYDVRVSETSSVVRLRLVEHRVDGKQVCPDLAMEHQQRAVLGDPLGRRTVIDAETGAVLLRP
ncbi:MAG TPA: hypothetical protein VH857_00870 [Actinomycetes bacterium]|nr:hypothetical protein [Actinomycetes bacterium]